MLAQIWSCGCRGCRHSTDPYGVRPTRARSDLVGTPSLALPGVRKEAIRSLWQCSDRQRREITACVRGSDNLRSPVNRGSLRSIRSHAPHGQFLCSVRPIALHVELICPIPLVYRELYPHVMSPYLIPKKKLL